MPTPHHARHRLDPAAQRAAAGARRRGIQIGPKIRIGGSIGHAAQSIKEGIGKTAKFAAMPVSFFNPALGAALAAGGKALDTTDGGSSLTDLALAGAKTYGVGKAGQGLASVVKKLPGIGQAAGAIGGVLGGGAAAPAPGAPPVLDTNGIPVDVGAGDGGIDWGGILGGLGKAAGGLGGYLKDNGGTMAMGGLAAAQALAAAKASQRAGEFQDKGIKLAEGQWEAGAPLRQAGMAGALTPKKVDLSRLFAPGASNPFARGGVS